MAKNEGKKFEEDIEKSVPADWFFYRLKDSSGSWSNEPGKSRFTPKNMSDCFIFNGTKLYSVECKSFISVSMPYAMLNDDKGKKLKQMLDMGKKENCEAGYLLNFRKVSKTYYVDAEMFELARKSNERKSFSIQMASDWGFVVGQEKKIVRYKYDLQTVL